MQQKDLKFINYNVGITGFLRSIFSTGRDEFSSKAQVELRYKKGNKTVAGYVVRGGEGTLINRKRYASEILIPPYIKETAETSIEETFDVGFKEGEITGSGEAESMADIASDKIIDIEGRILGAEEKQISEFLDTGNITVKDSNNKAIRGDIPFERPTDCIFTEPQKWDGTANSPIKTETKARKLIANKTGRVLDIAVMGSDAYEAFLNNDDIKSRLKDTSPYIDIIRQNLSGVAVFVGMISGVKYYAFFEQYKDLDGDMKYFIDPKKVVYSSSQNQGHFCYGLPSHKEAVPTARFVNEFSKADGSTDIIEVHSCPAFNPNEIDGYVTAQVLT